MQQFAVSPTPEQSVTEYEHNYAGDEIGLLTFVAMKMPPDARGADLRKSSIRRVDLPTHRIHSVICMAMTWIVCDISEICRR